MHKEYQWMLDHGERIVAAKGYKFNLSDVVRVPLHKRRTIRSLAKAIGVKKSTLHRWFKEGLL